MSRIDWASVKYFKAAEFDSPDKPGTGEEMSPRLVYMLDALRGLMGKSFSINSGFRTAAHNAAVGGAPHSAHVTGEAVDVSTRGWTQRERIDFMLYARRLGFNGVGIAGTFIHIDMKPRQASWHYVGHRFVTHPLIDEPRYA